MRSWARWHQTIRARRTVGTGAPGGSEPDRRGALTSAPSVSRSPTASVCALPGPRTGTHEDRDYSSSPSTGCDWNGFVKASSGMWRARGDPPQSSCSESPHPLRVLRLSSVAPRSLASRCRPRGSGLCLPCLSSRSIQRPTRRTPQSTAIARPPAVGLDRGIAHIPRIAECEAPPGLLYALRRPHRLPARSVLYGQGQLPEQLATDRLTRISLIRAAVSCGGEVRSVELQGKDPIARKEPSRLIRSATESPCFIAARSRTVSRSRSFAISSSTCGDPEDPDRVPSSFCNA